MPKIFYFFDLKDFVYLLYAFLGFAFSKSVSLNLAPILKLNKEDERRIRNLVFSVIIFSFVLFLIARLFILVDSVPTEIFKNH